MNNSFKKEIQENLSSFLEQFYSTCKKSKRDTKKVQIVFVTKYLNAQQFVSFLQVAKKLNLQNLAIGENRIQQAESKIRFLERENLKPRRSFRYMMIGHLQENKINKVIKIFDEVHSIDSLSLAQALDKRLKRENKLMPVFLQVNVSSEKTKHGVKVEQAEQAIQVVKELNNLQLKGLMTMAPLVEDQKEARPIFRKLRQLADKYHLFTSMGMSNDWQVAVEEGSDVLRVGRLIFG